jgi:hypothetical protein
MSGTRPHPTDRHVKDPACLRWQWGTGAAGLGLFAGFLIILIEVFDPGTARHMVIYDLVRFGAVGLVAFFVWFLSWFFRPLVRNRVIRRTVLGASLAVVVVGSVRVLSRL